MKTRLFIVCFAFAMFFISRADAANLPSPRLDAIASQVAGKPLSVHCEQDAVAWDALAEGDFARSLQTLGFVYPGGSTVYLAPRVCNGLTTALRGSIEDAGYREFSLSLMTLVHEAVHLRGISDEGVTECATLPLVVPLAVLHFKLKMKLSRIVKVKGKFVTKLIPNPAVSRIKFWVQAWHDVKPIEYRGNC